MTSFQPGVRRRLRDAQRFDDRLGYGFAYALYTVSAMRDRAFRVEPGS